MDFSALQAFTTVAREQSFSRAAEALFLTQSAVSKRVAGLEDELRTRLFDRIGRQVRLTEAGEALLPRARRALDEMEAGRQAIADLAGAVGGRLQIATSHHIGLHRLPPVLRAFAGRYPEVELDLHFLDSEDACAAVDRGELELAVVTLPTRPPATVTAEVLWDDPLAFTVAADHRHAAGTAIQPGELAREPAILPAANTFTRRIVTAALRPAGVEPRIALETNYLETIKMMVSVGLGWSVLPRRMLADGDVAAVELAGIRLQRQLGLIRRSGRTLGNAAHAFIEVARAHGDAQDPGNLA